jgi:mono/diheme cytochrome c family protein
MRRLAWLMFPLLAVLGCDDVANMRQQRRVDPFAPSRLQEGESSARPVPLGSVSTAGVVADPLETGAPPRPPVTLELLRHGQVLFNVHCSVCHGRDAYGRGMVVQRGFPEPPSFHTPRLRELPDEHIFLVITEGLGKMPSYAADVAAPDRWAVIAYVRALQLSQNAQLSDVPAAQRADLETGPPAQAPPENPERQP